MTFINPAILFGLLAASIPILLHFLNLRKLKKIEFSTLSFLKELQKTKIRRIKLKQWFLLLLRILIIVSLVFAFARPAIKSTLFGSSTTKTTAVFIIDNTTSMSIVSNEGSYFNKIKEMARNAITNFEPGDEIAVIPSATSPGNEFLPQSNLHAVKKEIEEIQISRIRKTLNASIIKAGQILYGSGNFNKELYLFTDLQSGSIYDLESELSNMKELFKGANIFVFDLSRKSAMNAGVSNFKLSNQIFEKNKRIGFNATITNYSGERINNSIASLFINDRRNAQQSVSLNAKESKELFFETTLTDTGLVNSVVELEEDDNNYDNRSYLSFYVPDKIKLLLAYELNEDAAFVKLALSQSSNLIQFTETRSSQLPVYSVPDFDALVLIGATNENGILRIKNYLNNGGRVLFFPSSNSDIIPAQNLFRELNLPIPEQFIGNVNSYESRSQFEEPNLNHPIFSNLFEEKSKTKIESPDIYRYLKIIPGEKGTNLISMFDKSAFLSEHRVGKGIFIAFNTSPVLSWGNLPVKSIFPTLINKSISYISSKAEDNNSNFTGEEIYVNIERVRAGQLKITRPDYVVELVNIDPTLKSNFVRYSNTDKSGIYKFHSGEKLLDFFSINQDPRESSIEYHSQSDLSNYLDKIGFEGPIVTIGEDQNSVIKINNARFGTELWKIFVIAALLFSLIEMLVARSSRKETEQINS